MKFLSQTVWHAVEIGSVGIATPPAVIGGYIDNPFCPQPWIEDAMAIARDAGPTRRLI